MTLHIDFPLKTHTTQLSTHNTLSDHTNPHHTTLHHTTLHLSAFTEMAALKPDVWIHCGYMKSGVYGLKVLSTIGFRPKATLQVW